MQQGGMIGIKEIESTACKWEKQREEENHDNIYTHNKIFNKLKYTMYSNSEQ